jgi:transcriptional regulator with XRE-family HTH domain
VRNSGPPTVDQLAQWEFIRATLRKRRKDMGLTGAQLSAMMGKNPEYVSYLENNSQHFPTLQTLMNWMSYLGMKINAVEAEL